MSNPTLSQFSAELHKRNISRASNYYIEIVPPPAFQEPSNKFYAGDVNLVSMWCNTAMTPQLTIATQDNHIEAGVRRKYAYDQDYQNLTLSFYLDQQFAVKRFFDQWKYAIVPQRRNFNYPEKYTASVLNLYIIDQEGKETYKYEYSNIFPKSINAVELSYASGASISSFTVDFVFEEVYYSSLPNYEYTSRPDFAAEPIPENPPPIAKEDSSWRGRGANGTRWTKSTNGIKTVLPY